MFLFLLVADLEKDLPNTQVVEYLYDNYYGFVMLKLFRLLPECSDLNDIAQDVFLSMLSNNISVDTKDDTAVKKYLTIVCKHAAIAYSKDRDVELLMPSDEVEQLSASGRSLEEIFVSDESANEIVKIIMSLSEKKRDVCYLKYLVGLSNKEIAKILGIAENTVTSRLYNSRREIKVKYEKLKKRF